MVPMQGRNPACCDATPTSNAVDIEHRLREVVDDDGIFAFYHKGVAHRFEIVNGRPTVDRRPILQDRGHRPIRPRPNDVVLMRSEEHTSELQSLMRNSYAVFCLKKKKHRRTKQSTPTSMNHTTNQH